MGISIYNPQLTLLQNDQLVEQRLLSAKFSVAAGGVAGAPVMLDGSTVTAANDGLNEASWKLADGTDGIVYLLSREVYANTVTEIPLDDLTWQDDVNQPQLSGQRVTALRYEGLLEIEADASGNGTLIKQDAGDGQVGASETVGAHLVAHGGLFKIKEGALATLATVGVVRGYTDATEGGSFRIVIELTPNGKADIDT